MVTKEVNHIVRGQLWHGKYQKRGAIELKFPTIFKYGSAPPPPCNVMAINFSFGLVAFSEVNRILILLAQKFIAFPLYRISLGYWGHISSLKHCYDNPYSRQGCTFNIHKLLTK